MRPAVDCLFDTAVDAYGRHILAVILTGMGEDGLSSSRILKKHGVPIIIQDKETSSGWGMPGAIANESLHDAMIPGLGMIDILKGIA